jgi:mRNA-degrading endonuclease RelE of RelBE toxin-antitoxin system
MMNRELRFTPEAEANLKALTRNKAAAGILKQVQKTLGLLETNLHHPSLNTHAHASLHGPNGEPIFEAYVQKGTPGAYRIFFYYGSDRVEGKRRTPVLTIIAITPHP